MAELSFFLLQLGLLVTKGFLCLVLHGHLPFVRHPEVPELLEEDWFFEAVTEVYLPLLDVLMRLQADGVNFKVALSLSPTLTAMLQDSLLVSRYRVHLENLIRLAESECRRTAGSADFAPLAQMYRERFLRCRRLWVNEFHGDLIDLFRALRQSGQVEFLTTAATHGYLPLMEVCPSSIKAQVEIGCRSFERIFGSRPAGFWMPECGYTPLVGQILAEAGIRYTFLETHGILHAAPSPKFGVYAPIRSPSGLALFGRDPETAHQVWSRAEGYPGDEWYRDFYRDIGFDLEEKYIKPFLYHGGLRLSTGMKYFRITGRADAKEPYNPARARERIEEHARDFLFSRQRQAEHLHGVMGQPPVVVAMYDAELFGHWWFEGPAWIENVFRKFAALSTGTGQSGPEVQLTTPSEVLERLPRMQKATPHLSSWGWKGYNEVWLQGANAWIYRHLHQAAWRMRQLVASHPKASGITRRALNQALRELFLAQASDWAFILAEGTASEYAKKRFNRHVDRFTQLYEQIQNSRLDESWLTVIEKQDNLFPFIDYTIYG